MKGVVNLRGRGTGQGSRPEGRGRDLPDLGLGWSVVIVVVVIAASRSFYLVFQAESPNSHREWLQGEWLQGCGQPSFSLCRLALSSTIIPG